MTYVVYADVLFGYQLIFHITFYFMISAILWQTIRIKRTLLWSILMAAFSTGIFLTTINISTILYYIIYAITYFIMTYYFTKSCCFENPMLVCAQITFICSSLLAGIMNICKKNIWNIQKSYLQIILACFIAIMLCRFLRNLFVKRNILMNHVYPLSLVFPDMTIHTQGFLDTGNQLYNPYTKKPVIILDYRLLKEYLPKSKYYYVEEYHRTGQFRYEKLNADGPLVWFPLPYSTIHDKFAVMPACTIKKLVFHKTNTIYQNVTAGISKESFMDKNQYRVLLHEGLNPKKRGEFK